jgi:hypothetical protein
MFKEEEMESLAGRTNHIQRTQSLSDQSTCFLMVRVPGCRTEMYCVSCEVRTEFIYVMQKKGPPLWSNGQEFLATDPEVHVRFPALPDVLRSSVSGTGSTQPQGLLERKSSGSGLERREYGRRGSVTLTTWHPSIRKSWH